ncbi:hypothetical protein HPB47_007022, partial [Ixodes persulcatus]
FRQWSQGRLDFSTHERLVSLAGPPDRFVDALEQRTGGSSRFGESVSADPTASSQQRLLGERGLPGLPLGGDRRAPSFTGLGPKNSVANRRRSNRFCHEKPRRPGDGAPACLGRPGGPPWSRRGASRVAPDQEGPSGHRAGDAKLGSEVSLKIATGGGTGKDQQTLTDFIRCTEPLPEKKVPEISNKVATMVALDLQPYSIVEDRGFKELLTEAVPNYLHSRPCLCHGRMHDDT